MVMKDKNRPHYKTSKIRLKTTTLRTNNHHFTYNNKGYTIYNPQFKLLPEKEKKKKTHLQLHLKRL